MLFSTKPSFIFFLLGVDRSCSYTCTAIELQIPTDS